jgi:hypothetical protein
MRHSKKHMRSCRSRMSSRRRRVQRRTRRRHGGQAACQGDPTCGGRNFINVAQQASDNLNAWMAKNKTGGQACLGDLTCGRGGVPFSYANYTKDLTKNFSDSIAKK